MRITFVMLGGIALCSPSAALAWNESEHAETGATGYRLACDELRNDPDFVTFLSADPANLVRFEMLCPAACDLVGQQAADYGQMVAISGDHLATAAEWQDRLQGRYASSTVDYGVLALDNHDHFEPRSIRIWRETRMDALSKATSAALLDTRVEQIVALDEALTHHAFADHFLQDSFAAGHIGINRAASGPGAAWMLHNYWNEHGRLVRDGFSGKTASMRTGVVRSSISQRPAFTCPQQQSRCEPALQPIAQTSEEKKYWRTFGDGALDRCKKSGKDTSCWDRLVSAQKASVRDFIVAFTRGVRDADAELATELSLPHYAFSPRIGRTWWGTWLRFVDEVEGPNTDSEVPHWSAWTPVTHTSRPAYRSFELFASYNYERIVQSPHSLLVEAVNNVLPMAVWWRAGLGVSLDMGVHESSRVDGATFRFKPGLIHTTFLSFAQNVFNHEVSIAEINVPWRPERARNKVDFVFKPAAYRLNIELGKFVFHGDVGLALGTVGVHNRDDEFRFGYFAGGGLSYVITASGGGNWHGQGR
ncbi:MAG: uncharacterized protein JWN04_696 [Myxococcaceae bacterium]|nr:uncharacterized protein [Myxococcaceae bacterium]